MPTDPRLRVTALLAAREGGPEPGEAPADLLPIVYDQLRELARGFLRQERPGHTLQATAMVHEAYGRLVDTSRVDWRGRTHFLCVAAQAMRRLLCDHARHHAREKRGGRWRRVTLHEPAREVTGTEVGPDELAALDAAIARLAELDSRQARCVELRFFAGLSVPAVAEALGVSSRTVERDWTHARAWLKREITGGETA